MKITTLKYEDVHSMYYDEKLSLKQIGQRCNVSDVTVLNFMKDNLMDRRSKTTDFNDRRLNIKEIKKLYNKKHYSISKLATHYGVSNSKMLSFMRENKMKLRSMEEFTKQLNAHEVQTLYYNECLSLKKVGEKLGVSESVVLKFMNNNNMPRRSNHMPSTI